MDEQKNKQDFVGDIEFEDSEQYRGKEEAFGIKEIVMRQYNKCVLEGSKEMTGGGIKKRMTGGMITEALTTNQREVFINSVKMLHILLLPEIKKNEKIVKNKIDTFKTALKNSEGFYKPKIDGLYEKQKQNRLGIDMLNIELGDLNDRYEIEKVKIYRGLMTALAFLLDYLNYFEEISA